jgi:hypothetical protein
VREPQNSNKDRIMARSLWPKPPLRAIADELPSSVWRL